MDYHCSSHAASYPLIRSQAVEILYRAKANVFMVSSIVPDANFPYRMMRAVPRAVIVPTFTPDGDVVNATEVSACLREIVGIEAYEEEKETREREEDELHAKLTAEALLDSPTLASRKVEVLNDLGEIVEEAPPMDDDEDDVVGGEAQWPDVRTRKYFHDLRHTAHAATCLDDLNPSLSLTDLAPLDTSSHDVRSPARRPRGAGGSAASSVGEGSLLVTTSLALAGSSLSPTLPMTLGSPNSVASPGTPSMYRERQIAGTGAWEEEQRTRRRIARRLAFRIVPRPLTCLDCACLGYYHFNHKVWRPSGGWFIRNNFTDLIERVHQMTEVGVVLLLQDGSTTDTSKGVRGNVGDMCMLGTVSCGIRRRSMSATRQQCCRRSKRSQHCTSSTRPCRRCGHSMPRCTPATGSSSTSCSMMAHRSTWHWTGCVPCGVNAY